MRGLGTQGSRLAHFSCVDGAVKFVRRVLVPFYEYRCQDCLKLSEISSSVIDKPPSICCRHCGSENTRPIVSQSNVVLSSKSKTERLDPKYDKMVDSAMAKNPLADPDRLLRKMRDPGAAKAED